MHFFDLHCDTLYRALTEGKRLDDEAFGVSFKKMCSLNLYIGFFAIWIPDTVRGKKAINLFDSAIKLLEKFMTNNAYNVDFLKSKNDLKSIRNKGAGHKIILSVEGGAVLGGDIKNIDYLYKKGVKMMTLTWNDSCEIGDGVGAACPKGLSDFGHRVIEKMEKLNMIIDLSHASEKLFYDVAEATKKPFVLSHSNSQSVCPNPRNITDEQFDVVRGRQGLVGINFCKEFLNEEQNANFDDIRRHVEHFLELDGEDSLAFGSDFDGADVLKDVEDVCKVKDLYEYFLIKNYNEKVLKKIFFKNAFDFVFKNIC